LDDSDDAVSEDPFYDRLKESPQDFYDGCGFSVSDFDILYQIAEARGYQQAKAAIESLGHTTHFVVPSLALHWNVDPDDRGCFRVEKIRAFRQTSPNGDLFLSPFWD
jgi:hypothetical protein